jgi:hypothetical protein
MTQIQGMVIRLTQEQMGQAQEETMGTRTKFWFKHPQLGRCLFKYIRPNTGEDWSEKIAFELCKLLDLPSARYELAETANGDRGVIGVSFLRESEFLIHGNEVLSSMIPNYPASTTYKAYQHTVGVVMEAIREKSVGFPPDWTVPRSFTDARDLFVGYLLLDAWIGNSDRHHENWGFIRRQGSKPSTYLAPTYDHASCLGRELSDAQRRNKSIESYVNRCKSAFYLNEEDRKELKILKLFEYTVRQYPQASREWLSRLEQISEQQIDLMLQAFPTGRISETAANFAKKILLTNQERLLFLSNL